MNKYSHKDVDYSRGHNNDPEHCAICFWWSDKTHCDIVQEPTHSDGWCKKYVKD